MPALTCSDSRRNTHLSKFCSSASNSHHHPSQDPEGLFLLLLLLSRDGSQILCMLSRCSPTEPMSSLFFVYLHISGGCDCCSEQYASCSESSNTLQPTSRSYVHNETESRNINEISVCPCSQQNYSQESESGNQLVVAHTCNPGTCKAGQDFKATLGYLVSSSLSYSIRPCPKRQSVLPLSFSPLSLC